MVDVVEIIGVNEVKRALRKSHIILGSTVERNLKRAGLFLQRKSQEVVPIEFGVLKNSAGTKAIGSGWKTDVIVYYTASYAVYVHERTELRHAPGKIAKFLERPMRENKDKILRIIAGKDIK